ncbi:MAG: hypothetical protein AAGE52_04380 [Myxococcota bacterium]
MRRAVLLAGLFALGCGDDTTVEMRIVPEILSVTATSPQVVGTRLELTATNLDSAGESPTLRVLPTSVSLALAERTEAGAAFAVDAALLAALGNGAHEVELVLEGAGAISEAFPFRLDLAETLPIDLARVPSGSVFRNEEAILEGEGFLEDAEGEVEALVVGEFTADATVPVDVVLPVRLAEEGQRSRGTLLLTTAIGGPEPGTFEGTIALRSTQVGATPQTTDPLSTTLDFQPPAVFEVSPENVTPEQLVRVRGAGFLFGEDQVTLLRAEGMLTPEGGSATPIPATEIVLGAVSGSELVGPLRAVLQDDRLVYELFGVARGRFEGTILPIAIEGDVEVTGDSAPITLVLGAPKQVVWLRFLPGFYDSLALFGLGAAAGSIEELVAERVRGVFAEWNVEVRLVEPDDYSVSGYSVVEIGGADPNGRGLFGYDNTPGKDVGNLRLFDAIGGANAETQRDGFPGYGGVFVESLLGFSEDPPPGLGAGPEPDPLFDEIFAPVRDQAATVGEVRGEGERAAVVARALRALAGVIGETTAHELGHSFGLADPLGSRTVFHNPGDQPGCLMDTGNARPFGERAEEPGFAATQLCGDAPAYMTTILPR